MLLAALGFSLMGGSAKLLKGSFNAGQLVFFRNLVGAVGLTAAFIINPPVNKGGKFHWLIFRGFMGTVALYTLLYCVLHLPLSTAMTYNLTSAIFIALFSFLLFKEYHGPVVLFAVIIGFACIIPGITMRLVCYRELFQPLLISLLANWLLIMMQELLFLHLFFAVY
jgi:drug/metabolite transporter (DMT)-like permease